MTKEEKIAKERAKFLEAAATHFDSSISMAKSLDLESCEIDLRVQSKVDLSDAPSIMAYDVLWAMLEGRFSKMDKGMLQAFEGIEGEGYYCEDGDYLIIADLCQGEMHVEIYEDGAVTEGVLSKFVIDVSRLQGELGGEF